MHVSQLLCSAFNLDTDIIPDFEARCGLCGAHGPAVSAKRIIKSSSAEIADIFRGQAALCLHCAAAFGESRLLTSNLFASSRGGCKPMIATASATPERPAWRDLIPALEQGTTCVAIVTSNTKRRLWVQAVVSTVGPAWRVLFVDGNEERVLTVNHADMCEMLTWIESLLPQYSKRAIGTSLLDGSKDLSALALERQLAAIRHTDEFTLALFIAQKTGE